MKMYIVVSQSKKKGISTVSTTGCCCLFEFHR